MLKLYLSVFILLFSLSGYAEVLDRVVAVVGDEAITQTELDEAMLMLGGDFVSQSRSEVLNQLIERKVLVIQAERETLEIKSEELQDAVESTMFDIRGRFPSDSAYKIELKNSGTTEEELRKKYSKQIRETLLIQKLFQKKFGKELLITDVEALDFYNTHRDSILPEPPGVKTLWVNVPYKLSNKALETAEKKAKKVLKLAKKGRPFGELVKEYSDAEKTKSQGGLLGAVNINDLSYEFRNVVAKLKQGEAGIVKTDNIYHIIKCDAKYKDMVTLRDIVIQAVPTPKDSRDTKAIVEIVKESLQKDDVLELPNTEIISCGEDFIPLQMTPFSSLEDALINEVFSFSTLEGYQVIKPIEIREAQSPEWNKVRTKLKNYLYQRKLNKFSKRLVEKLKQEIFTKIML